MSEFTSTPKQPAVRSNPSSALICPVCRVRFRGAATCSRCGTDLRALMHIAARAWAVREASRTALRDGNLTEALRLSARARQLCRIDAPSSADPKHDRL